MRRRFAPLVIVLGVGAGIAVAGIIATRQSANAGGTGRVFARNLSARERAALSHVSSRGTAFEFPPQASQQVSEFAKAGYSAFTRLASRDGLDIFRVTSTSAGRSCYAAGLSVDQATPVDVIKCLTAPRRFPSVETPILDMSLSGGDAPNLTLRYMRLAGVAADGVAAISGLDSGSHILFTVPVVGNVYAARDLPEGVVAIEAMDRAGRVVTRVP